MNEILDWGLLKPEDIECRIATCKDGKTTILLYQETRNCMKHLDAMFGTFGWQIDYHQAGDMIIATMSVWDDEKQMWVNKSDTGSASNIEADKGFCSNCLKRCAVQFGLGRELYTAPRIVIDNSNKYAQYNVSAISYTDDGIINGLTIVDSYGNVVFNWAAGQTVQTYQPQPQQTLTQPQQYKLTKLKQQVGENDMIPKWLYGKAANAETMETLKQIWDENINYQQNKNFQNIVKKRKNELAIAV